MCPLSPTATNHSTDNGATVITTTRGGGRLGGVKNLSLQVAVRRRQPEDRRPPDDRAVEPAPPRCLEGACGKVGGQLIGRVSSGGKSPAIRATLAPRYRLDSTQDFGFSTHDFGFSTHDCGYSTHDCGFSTHDCGYSTNDCGFSTNDCGFWINDSRLDFGYRRDTTRHEIDKVGEESRRSERTRVVYGIWCMVYGVWCMVYVNEWGGGG